MDASFGGVFVEKKPWMLSNRYLENPDITDTQSKKYNLKNPSFMTRLLSDLLQPQSPESWRRGMSW